MKILRLFQSNGLLYGLTLKRLKSRAAPLPALFATLGLLAIPTLSYGAQVVGEFARLGDLTGGSITSQGFSVSADGSTVVGVSSSTSGTEAFRWQWGDATMTGLGDLAGGTHSSRAYGVSANGSVVVGSGRSGSGTEAFAWQESTGQMTGLGDLSGGSYGSVANAVSADGTIAVGYSNASDGRLGMRHASATMSSIGGTGTGWAGSIYAYGISDDGSTIVGNGSSNNGSEAFRYANGTITGLGDLSGGAFQSNAYGSSHDGSTIVGSSSDAIGPAAVIWENGGNIQSLGRLAGSASNDSIAYDVSSDGSLVVGNSGVPFLWDRYSGMRDAFELLETTYGVTTGIDQWSSVAVGRGTISADGRTITGTGTNPDSQNEAWAIRFPDAVAIAEPYTVTGPAAAHTNDVGLVADGSGSSSNVAIIAPGANAGYISFNNASPGSSTFRLLLDVSFDTQPGVGGGYFDIDDLVEYLQLGNAYKNVNVKTSDSWLDATSGFDLVLEFELSEGIILGAFSWDWFNMANLQLDRVGFELAPIPEPSSLLMLAASFCVIQKRTRKNTLTK